ncbi:CotH kinase family protein [Candidatus Xianfuyuplasma coldseepsis]|uniref:CotH protein n=1 Tax=Candidatus Xianfuyuplasma coldseepsis TaxID=2782163 RepID=A0A7L7KNV4_9MOLU|nr:CotH kinase family protein [Xianfuyuplasma coldseepsis]QMS84450.1 hypothetical protein G4Z02_01385 [Xianfuyuplasma coldseepsis]
MKQWLVFLVATLALLLVGCEVETAWSAHEEEFNRIRELLPQQYSTNLSLPESSREDVFVVYSIDGVMVEDNRLLYTNPDVDTTIELTLSITHANQVRQYTIDIIEVSEANRDLNVVFDIIFDTIDAKIPSRVTANLAVPQVYSVDADIDYLIDCTDIVRNRIVYTFPDQNETCSLTAIVTYDGVTRMQVFTVTMSGISSLPQIPTVYITTENNDDIWSKDIYTKATMSVDYHGMYDGDAITNAGIQIRLRGNSTMFMPKRPYKIKFDEKTAFFADYKEYDWTLLSNHADQSLVRNASAFWMADQLGMAFVPNYTFVDVYINDEYQGNYLVSDHVEVTNDRVDIEEHSANIDTGYLIEYDYKIFDYPEGTYNSFLVDNIPFSLKSPDWDEDVYSNAQKTYIDNYMTNLLDTLQNQEDYSDLIDEASFIDWFIVNEIFKNVDVGYSSVYYYKDAGEKLKMGPVWDFDLSSGVPGYLHERGPTGWYTPNWNKNRFFHYLMQYPEFQSALKERWNEVKDTAIDGVLDQIFVFADHMTYSRHKNFLLYSVIGNEDEWWTAPEILAIDTYDGQLWFLYDYLETRIAWLDTEINNFD